LGCGLCVTACPHGANHMVLRDKQAKLARSNDELYRKIGMEAIVGVARNRVRDFLRRS
jgi:Fe-S-cluster-containing hydrogenase component 2